MQVCSNVQIEPQLQPLFGESRLIAHLILMTTPGWIFLLNGSGTLLMSWCESHINRSLSSSYRKNEKKKAYDECVCNVEHGTFAPLVFSVAEGKGPIATTFTNDCLFCFLRNYIKHTTKPLKFCWLRCNSSFSLLHSLIMCLRGACSSSGRQQPAASNISLAVSEARL